MKTYFKLVLSMLFMALLQGQGWGQVYRDPFAKSRLNEYNQDISSFRPVEIEYRTDASDYKLGA